MSYVAIQNFAILKALHDMAGFVICDGFQRAAGHKYDYGTPYSVTQLHYETTEYLLSCPKEIHKYRPVYKTQIQIKIKNKYSKVDNSVLQYIPKRVQNSFCKKELKYLCPLKRILA
jgi:hypothetical protein